MIVKLRLSRFRDFIIAPELAAALHNSISYHEKRKKTQQQLLVILWLHSNFPPLSLSSPNRSVIRDIKNSSANKRNKEITHRRSEAHNFVWKERENSNFLSELKEQKKRSRVMRSVRSTIGLHKLAVYPKNRTGKLHWELIDIISVKRVQPSRQRWAVRVDRINKMCVISWRASVSDFSPKIARYGKQ